MSGYINFYIEVLTIRIPSSVKTRNSKTSKAIDGMLQHLEEMKAFLHGANISPFLRTFCSLVENDDLNIRKAFRRMKLDGDVDVAHMRNLMEAGWKHFVHKVTSAVKNLIEEQKAEKIKVALTRALKTLQLEEEEIEIENIIVSEASMKNFT